MLEEQARHISAVIQQAKQTEARSVEPTPEAEAEWVATIRKKAIHSQRFQQECTPGYYNNEGKPAQGASFLGEQYGGGPLTTSFASGDQTDRCGVCGSNKNANGV